MTAVTNDPYTDTMNNNDSKCDAKRAGQWTSCSGDTARLFYGDAEPAIGCGKHLAFNERDVVADARARKAATNA